MLLPRNEDIIHKAWLLRLLAAICDNSLLAQVLHFKGGTCAAMQGLLNRFSVDLDFDLILENEDMEKVRAELEGVFKKMNLKIKDKNAYVPQYFLKYEAPEEKRNSIKIDVSYPPPKANTYEKIRFVDIDRYISCETRETMFANKMVALVDRHEKTGGIAGRDIFDIHSFFLQGLTYNYEVIEERRGKSVNDFLQELIEFIEKNITLTVINQDLNHLLSDKEFQKIRKVLKLEVLMFLKDELRKSSC